MAEAGGSATTAGIDYGVWFTTYKITDLLLGEIRELEPEATVIPNAKGQPEKVYVDDLVIFRENQREFYNIKYRAPQATNWSLGKLKDDKVIKQFKKQFENFEENRLFFITESSCPLFAEVLPRAAKSESQTEVEVRLNKYGSLEDIKNWPSLISNLIKPKTDGEKSINRQFTEEFKKLLNNIDTEKIKKEEKELFQKYLEKIIASSESNCELPNSGDIEKIDNPTLRDQIIEYETRKLFRSTYPKSFPKKKNSYFDDWEELRAELGYSVDKMVRFSAKIEFMQININFLKETIKDRLKSRLVNSKNSEDSLFQIAKDAAIHKERLTKEKVIERLEEKGIFLKPNIDIESIREIMLSASSALMDYPSKFSDNIHKEREITNDIYKFIIDDKDFKEKKHCILLGEPGSGKTVVLRDILEKLMKEEISCIGFKVDYIECDTIGHLSQRLGFKDELINSLSCIAKESGKVVVIIDQLDALSLSMGKNRGSINSVINLIHQLSGIENLRIILSCRKYDFNYDEKLRNLRQVSKEFTLDLLNTEEVRDVLRELGINYDALTDTLRKILLNPLHLSIFCDISSSDLDYNSIKSYQDLFRELLLRKITNCENLDDQYFRNAVLDTVDSIADLISDEMELFIPEVRLENKSKEIGFLTSQGILINANERIGFFHQTLYDYCLARSFVKQKKSLYQYLKERHQGLFMRPTVLSLLSYLRVVEKKTYYNEMQEILNDNEVRFHIKMVVIDQICMQNEPEDQEWTISKNIFRNDDSIKKYFFDNLYTEGWLKRLIDNGCLGKALTDHSERNFIEVKLSNLARQYPDTIIDFMESIHNIHNIPEYPDKSKIIASVLIGLDDWKNLKAIKMFKGYRSEFEKNGDIYYYKILKRIAKYDYKFVMTFFFERIFEKIVQIKEFNNEKMMDHNEFDLLEVLMGENRKETLRECLLVLKTILEKTVCENDTIDLPDKAFYFYDRSLASFHPHYRLRGFITFHLRSMTKENRNDFLEIINDYRDIKARTFREILTDCYCEKPEWYSKEAYNLLCKIIPHSQDYYVQILIYKCYQYMEQAEKENINKLILGLPHSPEEFKNRFGHRNSFGFHKYALLNSIPSDERDNYPEIKKKYLEFERKFGPRELERPDRIKGGMIHPPLPVKAYKNMNLEMWRQSFTKYNETIGDFYTNDNDYLKGGITQHSSMFERVVSKNPDHFYEFIVELFEDREISQSYKSAGLRGLKNSETMFSLCCFHIIDSLRFISKFQENSENKESEIHKIINRLPNYLRNRIKKFTEKGHATSNIIQSLIKHINILMDDKGLFEPENLDTFQQEFTLVNKDLEKLYEEISKNTSPSEDKIREFNRLLLEEIFGNDIISTERGFDPLKLEKIVEKYNTGEDREFRKFIIDVIDYINKKKLLDDNMINILEDYALNDPDPGGKTKNGYYDNDSLISGMNGVRGSAARVLALCGAKMTNPDRIIGTLKEVSKDNSIDVRSSLIFHLTEMAKIHRKKVIDIFFSLVRDRNQEVIENGLFMFPPLINKDNFPDFIPLIEAIIETKSSFGPISLGEYLGELLCNYAIEKFPGSSELFEHGIQMNDEIIKGIIKNSFERLGRYTSLREKCIEFLKRFLDSDVAEIQKKYDTMFIWLDSDVFPHVYDFLTEYSRSKITSQVCEHFLEYLQKCSSDNPEKCLDIMSNYDPFKKDSYRESYYVIRYLIPALMQAYGRQIDDKYREKAMDIFDIIMKSDSYTRQRSIEVIKEFDARV